MIGTSDAEFARRVAAMARHFDERQTNGLPRRGVDKIARWAEIGTSRSYVQILDLDDLAHLELIAAEVMSQL